MATFKEGQELKAIFWPEGGEIEVGKSKCTRIVVVMETGQMARVPWFEVWKDGKSVAKYNGALVEGIEYAPDQERERCQD